MAQTILQGTARRKHRSRACYSGSGNIPSSRWKPFDSTPVADRLHSDSINISAQWCQSLACCESCHHKFQIIFFVCTKIKPCSGVSGRSTDHDVLECCRERRYSKNTSGLVWSGLVWQRKKQDKKTTPAKDGDFYCLIKVALHKLSSSLNWRCNEYILFLYFNHAFI